MRPLVRPSVRPLHMPNRIRFARIRMHARAMRGWCLRRSLACGPHMLTHGCDPKLSVLQLAILCPVPPDIGRVLGSLTAFLGLFTGSLEAVPVVHHPPAGQRIPEPVTDESFGIDAASVEETERELGDESRGALLA